MAIVAPVVYVNVARNKKMKLTKETLKQLIKEELELAMNESVFSKPSGLVQKMEFAVMIARDKMEPKQYIVFGDEFIFMKDQSNNVMLTGNVEAGRRELDNDGYTEIKSEEIQDAYKKQRATVSEE